MKQWSGKAEPMSDHELCAPLKTINPGWLRSRAVDIVIDIIFNFTIFPSLRKFKSFSSFLNLETMSKYISSASNPKGGNGLELKIIIGPILSSHLVSWRNHSKTR